MGKKLMVKKCSCKICSTIEKNLSEKSLKKWEKMPWYLRYRFIEKLMERKLYARWTFPL